MTRKSFVLSFICLVLAIACDEKSPTGPTVPLNQEFTLAPGEVATVESMSLHTEFTGVTGDSRCPADAICIQGGDALVNIRVFDSSGSTHYELHTGDSSQAAITHGAVRIELVQLQPYPFSSRTIQPDEYRATLKITPR
jgi:hypothetical protein